MTLAVIVLLPSFLYCVRYVCVFKNVLKEVEQPRYQKARKCFFLSFFLSCGERLTYEVKSRNTPHGHTLIHLNLQPLLDLLRCVQEQIWESGRGLGGGGERWGSMMREQVRRKEGEWKGQRVDSSTLSVSSHAAFRSHRSLKGFSHLVGICWGSPVLQRQRRDGERDGERDAESRTDSPHDCEKVGNSPQSY